jgi:probable F420-dependent oxidoreductase
MSSKRDKISIGLAFGTVSPQLNLEKDTWKSLVQRIEALGFSGIFIVDHLHPQWDPITTMAAIGAVTERIDVGSMVCSVDYRHPVIYAKSSATINLISNNRHIFGIGAGWDQNEYNWAGIPFDKASTRIRRLEEAVQIIKGMWTQESTSLDGKYYQVKNLPKAVYEQEYARPRLMIGGGGKMTLRLAGRHADIVNVAWRIAKGENRYHKMMLDGTFERLGEKVEIVRESAKESGRDPDEIVYSQWIATRRIHGDPLEEKKKLAKRFNVSVDEISGCTWIMVGEMKDIVEDLRQRYEEFGISHFIIDASDSPNVEDLEYLSENLVKPLS